MLDAKDYGPGMAIYSYVVRETGENIHIDSEKLRQWCSEQLHSSTPLEVFDTPVELDIAMSFLQDNVIDLEHCRRVSKLTHWDPLIYCKYGTLTQGRPDVMLVDGHHRYFIAAFALNRRFAPAFVLEREQWQPFQIVGLPDLSEGLLRAMPPRGGAGR